jgi:putative SOS response-associated peptidase YedK
MPAILADLEQWLTWINPAVSAQDALSICGPLSAQRMTARPLPLAFNDPRNKSAAFFERAATDDTEAQPSLF